MSVRRPVKIINYFLKLSGGDCIGTAPVHTTEYQKRFLTLQEKFSPLSGASERTALAASLPKCFCTRVVSVSRSHASASGSRTLEMKASASPVNGGTNFGNPASSANLGLSRS